MKSKADIKISVHLNEKKVPYKLEWEATDTEMTKKREAQALLLSLWDKNDKNTLGVDLWTEELLISDLNIHYFQTLMKMADTYYGASKDAEMANFIKQLAYKFANKAQLEVKEE